MDISRRRGRLSTSLAAGGAVVGGRLTSAALRRFAPDARVSALSLSLVPVALVYPLARTSAPDRAAILREIGGVAAMTVLARLAVRSDRAQQVAALGWLAHAAFDVAHDPGRGSRLPDWYPAVCTGYDAGVAWDLLARP